MRHPGLPVATTWGRASAREASLGASTARDIMGSTRVNSPALVLGAAVEGRAHLVVSVAPALVQRGITAPALVKTAAKIVGGGGGGRDTLAQAGGRDPDKLGQAIEAAENEIISALEA